MTGKRAWLLIPVVLSMLLPFDAAAQGRGRGNNKDKDKSGKGGPAFCRSGAGHPVFGWEWCRERGWDRPVTRNTTPRRAQRVENQSRDPYPDRYRDRRTNEAGFDNEYADGYEKGLDDGRARRTADPTRHAWYRSANRDFDPAFGSRAAYANVYREGFRAGYEAGFADGERYGRQTSRFPWPF